MASGGGGREGGEGTWQALDRGKEKPGNSVMKMAIIGVIQGVITFSQIVFFFLFSFSLFLFKFHCAEEK